MRDGHIFGWTNTTWDGVAKGFYLWYCGRPESKHFIMKAKDGEGKTTACIIRSEIVAFETYWKLEPAPVPPKPVPPKMRTRDEEGYKL